jgi:hypothetical protein
LIKKKLYKLPELRNTDSENNISPDEIESSSSDEYSSSSSSTDIDLVALIIVVLINP